MSCTTSFGRGLIGLLAVCFFWKLKKLSQETSISVHKLGVPFKKMILFVAKSLIFSWRLPRLCRYCWICCEFSYLVGSAVPLWELHQVATLDLAPVNYPPNSEEEAFASALNLLLSLPLSLSLLYLSFIPLFLFLLVLVWSWPGDELETWEINWKIFFPLPLKKKFAAPFFYINTLHK